MSIQTKLLLETWKTHLEKLSRKETEKRRKKKINPAHLSGDEIIPPELQRLSRGIISDQNACHNSDGEFSNCKDRGGSYSYDGNQGERSGESYGKSQKKCGRLKRSDGHKYKCKSGELREGDVEIDSAYLKATIERAVKAAVKVALEQVSKDTGCSLNKCLAILDKVNRAEDGNLYTEKK